MMRFIIATNHPISSLRRSLLSIGDGRRLSSLFASRWRTPSYLQTIKLSSSFLIEHYQKNQPCQHSYIYCHWPLKSSSSSSFLACPNSRYCSTVRLFWSSADEIANEIETDDDGASISSTNLLPVSPITPSNISATSLIVPSTIESLKSLPECKYVLDILTGDMSSARCSRTVGDDDIVVVIDNAKIKEAHSNLQRARDILQSMPEMQMAIHLLEVDLLSLCGKFALALDALTRYTIDITNKSLQHDDTKKNDDGRSEEEIQIQFIKAKLLVHSGQFTHALSEYEDILEGMEREVERQTQQALKLAEQQQQQQQQNGSEKLLSQQEDILNNSLPVIHGASALTGVGVTKLLIHLREEFAEGSTAEGDIIECIETATEMLLESRKDAASCGPKFATLAVDLGLAASISLTNLGVTYSLLYRKKNKRAIKYWKRGIRTLDKILEGAVGSATIIPKHKFQCMESVRARLYCNIAWALLGLDSIGVVGGKTTPLDNVSDETLKDASDAAKKALDIYDELINGSKVMRGEGTATKDDGKNNDDESDNNAKEEQDETTSEEWEQILKDSANLPNDPTKKKPKELPISHLWKPYHRSESARALGLVAQCYASAGAAVTAEGLFQSSLDASSSYPFGQDLKSDHGVNIIVGKGVSLTSPNLGLIARDVRLWYAMLCDNWEKRKGDADRIRLDALKIEDEGVLKGYVRDENGVKKTASSLESSLWLFSPNDFEK